MTRWALMLVNGGNGRSSLRHRQRLCQLFLLPSLLKCRWSAHFAFALLKARSAADFEDADCHLILHLLK